MDDTIIAASIKAAAIHHKATCKDGMCNVVLYALGEAYKHYVRRTLFEEEALLFI